MENKWRFFFLFFFFFFFSLSLFFIFYQLALNCFRVFAHSARPGASSSVPRVKAGFYVLFYLVSELCALIPIKHRRYARQSDNERLDTIVLPDFYLKYYQELSVRQFTEHRLISGSFYRLQIYST